MENSHLTSMRSHLAQGDISPNETHFDDVIDDARISHVRNELFTQLASILPSRVHMNRPLVLRHS